MKTSVLTAVAMAGLIVLTGCSAGSSEGAVNPSASSSGTAATTPASVSSAAAGTSEASTAANSSTEGKLHFAGDYSQTTEADSNAIQELSKQWVTPEKQAALKAKLDAAGLSSNIPAEIQPDWYSVRSGAICQMRFDGHTREPEGVFIEIEKIVVSEYCPELG